jgi:hypothetical protein
LSYTYVKGHACLLVGFIVVLRANANWFMKGAVMANKIEHFIHKSVIVVFGPPTFTQFLAP